MSPTPPTAPPALPRLSSPLGLLRPAYEVVVVGSGYGGGIAASRLARAGRSVCVLERGRELLPGDFPDTERKAAADSQVTIPAVRAGRVGSATALFDFHVEGDVSVLRGCGLGGTSLINAGVALEPDPEVFADPAWPAALRADRAGLRTGFDRARAMLQPRLYPQGWPALAKHEALRRAAQAMGEDFVPVPINVSFDDRPGPSGLPRRACNLCGDCVTGCNHGAKNTVATTYLPDAWRHGAELFTQIAVDRVEARPDGRWAVHCDPVGAGRDAFGGAGHLVVVADVVVLAAGTLGSTGILLRSSQRGLSTSARLGETFSGNGDVIGFSYDGDQRVDGIGAGADGGGAEGGGTGRAVGPTITAMIDGRRPERPLAGRFLLQEGALPGAIRGIYRGSFRAASQRWGQVPGGGAPSRRARRADCARGLYDGAVARTQTLLGMGRDSAAGRISLDERGALRLRWPGAAGEPIIRNLNRRMRQASAAIGATFVPNPAWCNAIQPGVITVHPLGGCAMAEDGERGVTDHAGRVFSGRAGTEVHEGLYVCDGSVIPTPLGVNPLLTISALAERCVDLLARARGWVIDRSPRLAARRELPAPTPARPGIRFTERMAGFVTLAADGADALDHGTAARTGEALQSPMSFVLTLEATDLEASLAEPRRRLSMYGTVVVAALSDQPLQVSDGRFELLSADPEEHGVRRMVYEARLTAVDGRRWRMLGHKRVHDGPGSDTWSDTTTLAVDLHDEDGALAARGQLRISLADFRRQLGTMQATNAASAAEALATRTRFLRYFLGTLLDTCGGPLARPAVPEATARPRPRRALRTPSPSLCYLQAADGAPLLLTRYRGGEKGPVLLLHGLGVSSRIFSLDTVQTNLVEYLVAHGYDVWLLDYRASIASAWADRQADADVIAALDLPAAVGRVRQETAADSVQVVAHCFGATVFYMSMLSGALHGVRAAVTSQASPHLAGTRDVALKSRLHLPGALQTLGVQRMSARTDSDAGPVARVYDRALGLVPTWQGSGCRSATCRRIEFLYAPLYRHDQLDLATHDSLHELFGVANLAAFRHLSRLVRAGHLVDAAGRDAYMPHVERLALPIRMIHGADNACFDPTGSARSLAWLRAHNDPALYSRVVIPNHGHIDCILGKRAAGSVYPHILDHLEETL